MIMYASLLLTCYSLLQYISLVGNSLGGLYARHAIRLLYTPDAPDNRVVAGLEPETFMVRTSTLFFKLIISSSPSIMRRCSAEHKLVFTLLKATFVSTCLVTDA
jgi:Putative serine esterase (DUF676)